MNGRLCLALCLLGLVGLALAYEGQTCVDITRALPCQNKPAGDHHICEFCEHGFFVRCEDDVQLTIIPCPHVENENGEFRRLIFDDVDKTCVENTPTCTRTGEV